MSNNSRMDMRAVAYEPGGNKIGILPDILSATVTIPRNDMPTISLQYPQGDIGVRGRLLNREIEVAIEIAYDNDWFEVPGGRFLSLKNTESPLREETGSKSFEAVHVSRYLQEALVWDIPKSEKDSDGKWNFKSVNAGFIFKTLWDRAKSRGWGKGLTLGFDQHKDSAGRPWPQIVTLAFGKSISLYQVMETLENLGMIDYQWQGRTLNWYAADTYLKRDLNVQWPLARGTTGAPETFSWEALCTNLLVVGENGASWQIANTTAPKGMRRIEKVVEAGGVSLESTAKLVARGELAKGSTGAEEVVREWDSRDMILRPFWDYRIGDWMSVQRGYSSFDRLRVVQVSMTYNQDGITGHTTFGNRLDDLVSRLAKRTKGIVGGAAIAGNTVRPAPEKQRTRPPAAPTGVAGRGDVVKDARGYDIGVIEVSWVGVTTDEGGGAQTADTYEMRVRRSATPMEKAGPWRLDPAAEMTIGFIENLDAGLSYDLQVRALAEGVPGAWSGMITVTVPKDAEPPPVPTPPRVENVLGVLVVTWDGKGVGDKGMPTDFEGIEVGVASPGASLEVKSYGTGLTAREQRIAGLPTGDWDIALRSVDRDGNKSNWSIRTTGKVVSNVDADAIRRQLDQMIPDITDQVGAKSLVYQRAAAAIASGEIVISQVPPDEGEVGKSLWVAPDGKLWRMKTHY